MRPSALAVAALALSVLACSSGETEEAVDPLEAMAAEKCPKVHLDRMDTDWVLSTGDPKTRLRLERDGEQWRGYYVDGFFTATELVGERREEDVRLVEVPRGSKKEQVDAGAAMRTVLFVQPSYRDCALQVFSGKVDAKGNEQVGPEPKEFLPFPDDAPAFAYRPFDGPVFLGDAAKKRTVADKQLAEGGGPKPDVAQGTVPVGVFTKAADDGDAACTYDMDLFFDDQLIEGGEAVAAGEVEGDWRHWYYEFDAPYSGNHTFRMHRYRTCDGERELVGVSGIEAILL